MEDLCTVTDTLALARQMFPGQRNNLDALCKRYGVNNAHRELHGALLDARILADVYLAMTGGQVSLGLAGQETDGGGKGEGEAVRRLPRQRPALRILAASSEETKAHLASLEAIRQAADGDCLWLRD